jgi:sugar/nucleoside kinase (ribokinase family)
VRRAGLFVGLSTLDVVYRVAAPPGPDEKVQASGQDLAAGGPVTNAAVTFAALGGAPMLVTALGRHVLARHVAAELASRGVTVLDAAPDRAEPPALSSAYVVDATGERSVVSVNAAGADPAAPDGMAAVATGAPVVLLDGQYRRLALAAAAAARAAGRVVVLDAGSWKPALPDLLPRLDVAACSAAFRVPGTASVQESVAALRETYGVPAVAVTAGPEPVRWWYAGATGEVQVPATTARDTLGAGDAFHGALAWALAASHEGASHGGGSHGGGSHEGASHEGQRGSAAGAPGSPQDDRAAGASAGGAAVRGGLPDAVGFAATLEFAARVAALRCETAGPRGWLDDPRLPQLAAGVGRG